MQSLRLLCHPELVVMEVQSECLLVFLCAESSALRVEYSEKPELLVSIVMLLDNAFGINLYLVIHFHDDRGDCAIWII